ncbi:MULTISPECIES: hypothetical protein [unclassified Methylobacterium]|uniref:hypothetical protein n=1 Tax=unclassified Methylobacterium TaxID=2615210 RepID=UPI00226AB1B2|nr:MULTISPECIES: hypothetical protein [unclassified Methylobacterium]
MLTRPEGPEPPREPFTCADVERWLKTAFRAMPYTPIYAPRGNTLQSANKSQPSATFDILAFTGTVLGDRSDERKILLVWARAIVTEGEIGGSIAQFCEARGWNRRTFDRKRVRACEHIAAEKNRIDGRG